jgi:hypothetical protein
MKSKAEGGGMKDESVVISIEWIKHAFILHPCFSPVWLETAQESVTLQGLNPRCWPLRFAPQSFNRVKQAFSFD